ncbi:MAG: hypothetical protein P4L73_15520 [Caulobacteraceae bacterium]|nr:hypothetical protein [Caulobacteraceae bacterium]
MKPVGAVVLAAAALWLFSPMLTPAHVEGFTASIGSIALHMTHDQLANYDRLFPFNLQFFAFSRLGTNLFVALLVGPLGLPAEWALRLAMWIGFVCLAGGSYVLVRRWTEAPPLQVLLVMVLTPGLAETGFFYNDNMLSAGLATLSLALLTVSARPLASVAAGALFGYAVLARTDCLLLAPAAALILWRREGTSWRFVGHCAAFGLASAGLASAILAAFGLTPVTVLRIAAHAVALWRRQTPWEIQPTSIALFAGPIGVGLAIPGVTRLVRQRRFHLLALLLGAPLIYNVVYLNKVWEVRQLAPLTPFFLSMAVVGLQTLLAPGVDRRLQAAAAVLAALVLLSPPAPVFLAEGPHTLVGRAWTPVAWRRWQEASRWSFGSIGRFVAADTAPLSVILTDYWDGDRYTHLQLQEHGFTPFDVGAAYPACATVAEGFQRGGVRVIHLRLHTPFLRDSAARLAPRLEGPGRACLAQAGTPNVTYVTMISWMDRLFGPDEPHGAWIDQARRVQSPQFDPLAGVRLTPALLAQLPADYRRANLAFLRSRPDVVARLRAHPVDPDLSAIR